MAEKLVVELGHIQKTLLLPLWGRAVETQKKEPLLVDKTAVEISNKIDYDFSSLTKNLSQISQLGWIIRSILIDKIITGFIEKHPQATIVNIGCGLDTTFDRIDNGSILWYDLDLPDVLALRRNFIQENHRRKFIECSFLNYEWFEQIKTVDNILFIAAGVLYYFEEDEIKSFFTKIIDLYPDSEIVFDATSPIGVKMANKAVIKSGGMDENSFLKWGLKSAEEIQQWDSRIKLLNEVLFFRNWRGNLSFKTRIISLISDMLRIQYMIHLKVLKP